MAYAVGHESGISKLLFWKDKLGKTQSAEIDRKRGCGGVHADDPRACSTHRRASRF